MTGVKTISYIMYLFSFLIYISLYYTQKIEKVLINYFLFCQELY
jgi:hypothetical protein